MFRSILAVGFLVGTAAGVWAQQFHWTPLERIDDPKGAVPAASGWDRPDVPKEIQGLDTYGYAQVTLVTEAKGKGIARKVVATNRWIMDVVHDGIGKVKIARPEDPTAMVTTRSALIFNPANVYPGKRDSAPQLLSAVAAVYPSDFLKATKEQLPQVNSLEVDIEVDAEGVVRNAKAVRPSDLAATAEAAARAWKFAPARKEGVAVEAKLRVPVCFSWPDQFEIKELSKQPVVISQTRPEYPLDQRRRNFGGEAVVLFVVDKEGLVRNPVIVRSNNPAFNQPSLDAVSKWRFKPGIVNGEPVNTRMMVPMVFRLEGVSGNPSTEPFEVSGKAFPKDFPEELKYDFPPKVKNAALGVYPFEELQNEERKKLTVRFFVTPSGSVYFPKPLPDDATSFDRAVRAMLHEFEFTPAAKDGKPSWGMLSMEVDFNMGSPFIPVSDSARQILRELKKEKPDIVRANELDEKPVVLSRRPPIIPADLPAEQDGGSALIEFFVDKSGAVQLPRIVKADHPSLGYAAAQAVSQWRFQPGIKGGKPVVYRVRAPIEFNTKPPAGGASPTAKP